MKTTLSLLALSLFLYSCETKEQNDIARAQICLNNATAANAANCKLMVNGHTSPEAFAIACSADFLAEGIDANAMASALAARDATSGAKNSMLGMMGIISFRTNAAAATAVNDCTSSKDGGFAMLANMSKASTLIAVNAGTTIGTTVGTKPTQAAMESALATIIASPTTDNLNTLGNAALSVQQNYCNADTNSSKVCGVINNAVSTNTTPSSIGTALLNVLNTP